jgi:hypothetical protein
VQRFLWARCAASFSAPITCSWLSQVRKWLCGTRKVRRKDDQCNCCEDPTHSEKLRKILVRLDD